MSDDQKSGSLNPSLASYAWAVVLLLWPVALIAEFHTDAPRSRAVAIHQTAIHVGVMAGGFTGYVADAPNLGWRLAFSVCGWVGAAYTVPLFFALRNPVRPAIAADAKPAT